MFEDLKPPLVVIGMHRSGTSFLSRVLHHNGIFMGVNQSGVNEARFFLKKNIRILKANSSRYDDPKEPKDLQSVPFGYGEFKRGFLGFPLRLGPTRSVVKEKGDWGWKDPRNTFTLPYWLQYFPEMKVIHIYRNGIDVTMSFYLRNSKLRKSSKYYSEALTKKVVGLALWERYYYQAESYKETLGNNMLTIKYENLVQKDDATIDKIESFTSKDLRKYILENAHGSKANKADYTKIKAEHRDLYEFATKSALMADLGYI